MGMDTKDKKPKKYTSFPNTAQFLRDLAYLEKRTGESTATVIRSAVSAAADARRMLDARMDLEEAQAAYVNQDGER